MDILLFCYIFCWFLPFYFFMVFHFSLLWFCCSFWPCCKPYIKLLTGNCHAHSFQASIHSSLFLSLSLSIPRLLYLFVSFYLTVLLFKCLSHVDLQFSKGFPSADCKNARNSWVTVEFFPFCYCCFLLWPAKANQTPPIASVGSGGCLCLWLCGGTASNNNNKQQGLVQVLTVLRVAAWGTRIAVLDSWLLQRYFRIHCA